MLSERRSGILLHPTSLPGKQPVGSLGHDAYHFIDDLAEARQSVWQILPLGPAGYGHCPYSCYSAFAGNPLLIDLNLLTESGELKKSDLPSAAPSDNLSDFNAAENLIVPLLSRACQTFLNNPDSHRQEQFNQFCSEQAFWLEDYVLYQALREKFNLQAWQQWPQEARNLDEDSLGNLRKELAEKLERHRLIQFFFFDQWFKLKTYANDRGIQILGDLPIFVAEDSADVWANQELFHLDDQGIPSLVAGVPPDYFSATGQRWGNPLYRWERMQEDDFSWWKARFHWNLELFDMLRVDHFRGFSACWAIPSDHQTAEHGHWLNAPGEQLFDQLMCNESKLPLVAEDLGIITPDVTKLRDQFEFPGMKILQFAFDSASDNPYLPHNLPPNSVIYTGTHDNDTTLGWWRSLDGIQKQRIKDYLRNPCRDMPWPLIETALSSVSRLAVLPMQDILKLPTSSRMNTPGTANGNWLWRMQKSGFSDEVKSRLVSLSHLYGRNLCISTEM